MKQLIFFVLLMGINATRKYREFDHKMHKAKNVYDKITQAAMKLQDLASDSKIQDILAVSTDLSKKIDKNLILVRKDIKKTEHRLDYKWKKHKLKKKLTRDLSLEKRQSIEKKLRSLKKKEDYQEKRRII